MSIDWDKDLECEHGEVGITRFQEKFSKVHLRSGRTEWLVESDTGKPLDDWMPRVYNKKPEPQKGEWWMCEIVNPILKYPHTERVLKWGDDIDRSSDHITPLYKMERVEE